MSSNISSTLKRIDIINYLEDTKKIRPNNVDYSTEYIKFVCEKFGIKKSDLHYTVSIDISKTKNWFIECHRQLQTMKNKHKKFFDAFVKLKFPLPPPKKVCFNLISSPRKIC